MDSPPFWSVGYDNIIIIAHIQQKGGNLPPISVKDTDFLYVDKYAIRCIMKVQKGATDRRYALK